MNLYPTKFGIRDLEEFSGVKAHTIRIWEKRYGLLAPDRTGTNIRYYGIDELRVIMNVAFLNEHGHKISRIAAMSPTERERLVRDTASAKDPVQDMLNKLKIAMLAFDEADFDRVTSLFEQEHGFRAMVEQLYVPLLERIGVLWQTNAICPAHEHFVSNIIRQRLIAATGALPRTDATDDRTYILYLPENEIHELGLLYVNYLMRARGDRTIYLGQSVPEDDLRQVASNRAGELYFISVLTTHPVVSEVPAFLERLRALLPDRRITLLVAGAQLARLEPDSTPAGVRTYGSLNALLSALHELH
ncbi:MAG: MerR family transcriptional regulator [Flavobacteriales bacterium]|nr:MerR family transcriptional regulator [Flavobacteriales bacterium]